MADPVKPSCATCQFFDQTGNTRMNPKPAGLCRISPPTPQGGWPIVRVEDWCGKHQPMPQPAS